MVPGDRYQAYIQDSVLGSDPVDLIRALYEAAIGATQEAGRCLITGDMWGRSKAVSKATNILTELLVSLDHEKGGALSQNLKRLYAYMQSRLFDAHIKKSAEPLQEVERLLNTLLEAWRVVMAKTAEAAQAERQSREDLNPRVAHVVADESPVTPYGGYLYEPVGAVSRLAFTF